MAERSRRVVNRGLKDDEIINVLNNSDIDDSDEDITYNPQNENRPSSSSSNDSDSSCEPLPVSRKARHGTSRGRNSRGQQRELVTRQPVNYSGIEWSNRPFSVDSSNIKLMQPTYLPTSCQYNKYNYVNDYISEDIFALIVEKTNQTSVAKTGRSILLTIKECKVFFGATILMSCINYPIIRMYWEAKWRIPAIANVISRDRYSQIRNSIKLVYDDDISSEQRAQDKLWKVRPILNSVTKGCLQQVPNQKVSVDEMMIPFTGSCGLKQYCPNKPNPTGLKAFVLANPDGLICNLKVYQGSTTFPELTNSGFGLGESAVLKLTEILVPGSIVYFDRYFTSIKLIEELLKRGIKSAGTIMKNRIPAAVRNLIISDSDLKRKGRGSFEVITRQDNSMAITKWYDNKSVIMLSSIYAADTTDECRRWCKKEKHYVMVTRPEVIKEYNINMGGVDMADRLLAVCPARARTNKWTLRFISHMFDIAVTNSWVQFRNNELENNVPRKKIQQLRFYKMEFGERLLEENSMPILGELNEENLNIVKKKRPGRPGAVPVPSQIKRTHGALHIPSVLLKQQRCRLDGCNNRSTIFCSFCEVALCLTKNRNCFELFHL